MSRVDPAGRRISKLWHRPMQVGILLKIPYATLERHVDARLHERGFPELRPAHAAVFQFLPNEGCRLTELARRANMTKQSMGELVDYLEARGFLERSPDPTDRRAHLIRPTRKTLGPLHDTVEQIIDDLERDWAAKIGKQKFKQLCDLLGELCAALEE